MTQTISMLAKCPRLPSTAYWACKASELNYVQEIVKQVLLEMDQICARKYAKIFGTNSPMCAEFDSTYSPVLIL